MILYEAEGAEYTTLCQAGDRMNVSRMVLACIIY